MESTVWAREPESPQVVDAARLAAALSSVCGNLSGERSSRYATWLVESAARHGEDPFLLGAVMHRLSRCRSDFATTEGIGLTSLQPDMYGENVRGRTLRYFVSDKNAWVERHKTLPHMLTESVLSNPEDNLEWAAALLAMWREQHAAVDAKFEQVAHRHHVSHFIWGDRVRGDRFEDRIFTDRRRLLLHYGATLPDTVVQFRGVAWGSPLEASPRVVSSSPGAARDEGLRRHRGVDIESVHGEPVLAMADGRVFFAGVDLPGQGARSLGPRQLKRVARQRMGKGGRFICIDHEGAASDEAYLRSCYMHLDTIEVQAGQSVERGQRIGTVGRTGMKRSAPHLHLEVKSDKRLYDARDVVPGILVGEPPVEPLRRRKNRPLPMASTHATADPQ